MRIYNPTFGLFASGETVHDGRQASISSSCRRGSDRGTRRCRIAGPDPFLPTAPGRARGLEHLVRRGMLGPQRQVCRRLSGHARVPHKGALFAASGYWMDGRNFLYGGIDPERRLSTGVAGVRRQ